MNTGFYNEVIKYAFNITENQYAFSYETSYLNYSYIHGVDGENLKKLDYWLKGIRQDFAKILICMNLINKIQNQVVNKTFVDTYYGICSNQANDEVSCNIEFIFTKYRSIFDYIYQVLEICIPPQLSETEVIEYKKLKKVVPKYNFFLRIIANKKKSKFNNILDMKWFKNIIDDRDFLIHDCASCLIFGDISQNIDFSVWKKDDLEKDNTKIDVFYSSGENMVDYDKYWAVHISLLIVYFKTIFGYIKDFCQIDSFALQLVERMSCINRLVDPENNEEFPVSQDIIRDLFKKTVK